MTANGIIAKGMGSGKLPRGVPKCVDPVAQDSLKHGE